MDDQYDGRIEIDTELDTSGFLKGTDKLREAMQGVTSALDSVAGKVANAFQEKIKAPEFEQFDDSGLEEAIAEWQKIEQEESEKRQKSFDDADASNLVAQYNSAEKAAERLAERKKALEKEMQEREDDAYAEQHAADEKTFDKYANSIEKNANSIIEAFTRISQASEQGFRNTSQVLNFSSNVDAAQRRIAELKQAMADLGEFQLLDPSQQDRYEQLRGEVERIESNLQTSAKLINQEAIEQARLNVVTAQEAVAVAANERERRRAMQQLRMAQSELAYAAQHSVTPKPDPEAYAAWGTFGARIKSTGATIVKAIGKDASRAFSALKSGIKKAYGWIKNLRSHASAAGGSVNGLAKALTSLKTMLVSRIKRSFISQIINTAKESIGALAQFDSAVDRSISSVKNSFKEAGTNLSVTLGNLISTVAPIITGMLDAVSAAVTKLNALIAMLRGQKTVTVAKKQNESYAASLNGTASAANKAAAAQKKYNATLTSYDELHKLSEEKEDNGGEGNGITDMFQNVPLQNILGKIPDKVIDFVQQIKDAINQGDWYGVGAIVGNGLDNVVTALDNFIVKITPKCAAAAAALGQGISGFAENFNFENLGIAIGDGTNLIFSSLDSFITNTRWGALGNGLATTVNGFFDRVKWREAGATVAHGVNGAIDFIYGAIEKADWKGYGKSLGEAVNKFIDETDFKKAGKTLGEAVKGILASVVSFLEEVEWDDVGEAIGDFIAGIDWGGVVEKIISAIINVKIGIIQLLYGFGKKIIMKIKDAIVEEAKSIGFDIEGENIILGILHGIGAALVGIYEWVKNHIFMPIVNAIKKAFGIASPAAEMEPLGDNIAGGILQGILSGAKAIFNFFLGLPKKIFEIITGALGTVIDAGGKVVGAIGDGVKGAWEGFKGIIGGLWNKIGDFLGGMLDGIKSAGKTLVGGIKTGVSHAWEGFKGVLSGLWRGIGSFLGGIGDGFKAAGEKLVGFIKDGVNSAWGGLKSLVGGLWDSLTGLFGGNGLTESDRAKLDALVAQVDTAKAAQQAEQAGKEVSAGYASGISSGEKQVTQAADAAAMWSVDAVKRRLGISSPSKVFQQIGEYIDAGLVDGIESGKQTAINTTANMAKSLTDAMSSNLAAETVSMELDGRVVDASAEGIMARVDTLTAGLDAITERLSTIADVFAGISIPMPEPALGTIIPPRTRVSDFSAETDDKSSAGLAQKLDQLIALLTAQQSRDTAVNLTVPVQIDQRKIGEAVARYTLSGQRMTNGGLR